jgi:transposase
LYLFRSAVHNGHFLAVTPTQAFVPLTFAPGEAYPFDWAEDWIVLDGVTTKVQVAHIRLCHSRMPFVQVYPRQTQEMVFDAHARALAFYGGLCERGIYDNMKTAVETVFIGKDRQFNRRFAQMCSHYLVEPVACSPGAGWAEPRCAIGSSTDGERVRSRTRLVRCASACSHRASRRWMS